VLISALPRPLTAPSEEVLTSALPRPLTAPADFAYDTIQRPTDCIHDSSNVYTHSDEQWLPQLAHLPPPPPVNTQSVPLSSVRTQTTASAYMNQDFIPALSAHRYTDNYQNMSANLSLPTHINVPTHVNAPLSQAIAFDQPRFSVFFHVQMYLTAGLLLYNTLFVRQLVLIMYGRLSLRIPHHCSLH